MKKNAILTFLFACVPGAGQMYYGYMQRGLSLITLFCVSFGLAFTLSTEMFIFVAAIVWMYSFFDVYDLIRYANAGQPRADGLLLVGTLDDLRSYLPRHNKILGWLLVAIGVYGVYMLLLRDILFRLFYLMFGDRAWHILDAIPGVIVSLVFIGAGLWLLGFKPAPKAGDLPPYPQQEPVWHEPFPHAGPAPRAPEPPTVPEPPMPEPPMPEPPVAPQEEPPAGE